MSVAVPAFTNACIAPDSSGSAVWLVGVSPANENVLQAYSINLANINQPTATLVANQTSVVWSSQLQKACFSYPGNTLNTNSPIFMQQFGANSYFINIYPNGTLDLATNFDGVGFVSPRTFSLSGAVGALNWFTAVANVSSSTTNSPWTGLRLNSTSVINSTRDFIISQYPTSNPLLSVGAYVPTSNTPAQGYHIVFDNLGGGIVYTTLDSAAAIVTSLDRILSLSNPQVVNMNGITLTSNAIPITMAGVAYILDTAIDGSSVLYSINPSQSAKLQRVTIRGNVPPFSASISATAMSSQIVIYGASSSLVATSSINSFDTVGGTWTGPGLVQAYIPPTPSNSGSPSSGPAQPTTSSGTNSGGSSKAPLGAIIGGVVGGLVVIALIAFFFVRRRKTNDGATGSGGTRNVAAAAAGAGAASGSMPVGVVYDHSGKNENFSPPMMQQQQQNYGQFQPQQQFLPQAPYQPQQQQYNPNHSYMSQSYGTDPIKDAYATSPSQQQQQQQQQQQIFQSQQQQQEQQQPYSYTPPTLGAIPQQQQQHPNIFQPQSDGTGSNPSYSQGMYTPSVQTPQTPYTPISQVHTPSTGAPSSPQYQPPLNQGYV